MKKTVKNKWVKALRSGDYKQTKGALRRTDEKGNHSYCCLGVLCDVMKAEWHDDGQGEGQAKFDQHDEVQCGVLEESFMKELDLKPHQQATLIRLNDSGKSFKYIAYYIERYL